jgi:outer membrane protein assembly factor BamB
MRRVGWVTAAIALVFFCAGVFIWAREDREFKRAQEQNDRIRADWDARLQVNRTDQALQREVREWDRDWRARYFHHLQFQSRGLLVLALTAGLAFWAVHFGLRRPLPTVRPAGRASHSEAAFFYAHRRKLLWALLVFAGVLGIQTGRNALRWNRFKNEEAPRPPVPAIVSSVEPARYPVIWGAFRGTAGNGHGLSDRSPPAWDGTRGESVVWTSTLALPGNSSPIVAGNRVILTGATRTEHAVWACDLETGRELWCWRGTAAPTQPETVLDETGFAASTPATDGRMVAAIFADGDLVGLDLDGRELWRRALGVPDNMYGHASSLVFAGNRLMVQWDQGRAEEGRSRLLALDPLTGDTRWETPRPVNASWATPLVIADATGSVVVLSASPWVIAYEAETGRELWRAGELRGDVAPSPVFGSGRIYALNTSAPLLCIRPGGTGDVTATHVEWSINGDMPDTCSPLVVSNRVFTVLSWGVLTARDAETGRTLWEHDLGLTFTASPTTAGGRLFLVATDGMTVIVDLADEFREIARYPLGDEVHASPVLGDGWILLRGKHWLWRIGGGQP